MYYVVLVLLSSLLLITSYILLLSHLINNTLLRSAQRKPKYWWRQPKQLQPNVSLEQVKSFRYFRSIMSDTCDCRAEIIARHGQICSQVTNESVEGPLIELTAKKQAYANIGLYRGNVRV